MSWKLGVIGMGPRGLSLLDRLSYLFEEHIISIEIHIFEPRVADCGFANWSSLPTCPPSRLEGGVINGLVRFATGVDIKMDYVKSSMLQEKVPVSRPRDVAIHGAWIIIPPRQGTLQGFPMSCDFEWVNLYKAYGIAGQRYGGASMTNAEVAGFVFQGENEEHLRQRAVELETWFNANSEWSS
ncbi:hypothetical protein ACFQ3K_06875 [Brucella gallinifaecis]|uniref:Uncharacterized protein n=1 Tax=Brucella gallinifaecis TaxID=215590 RepID=A0A502BKN0_9HYPH|nr:hypothetical protein [Brucella gallinifaecis]TPF74387.1 hypothetical protein FHY56_14855 [Brucella gallinifaecis]